MIVDNIIAVFDNTLILLHQIIATLHYILELNYTVVSTLLDVVSKLLAAVQTVLQALNVAVVDFIEQYGDFCTDLLYTFVYVCRRGVDFALSIVVYILSVLNYLLSCINCLLRSPKVIYKSVHLKLENFKESTTEVLTLPVIFVTSIYDGLSMIISTIINGWLYILSLIYQTFVTITSFFVQSFVYFVTAFTRALIFLFVQPINAVKAIFKNFPMEAFIGLVLCICIYYLIKFGIIRILIRLWLQCVRKILVVLFTVGTQAVYKARYHLIPILELILTYTMPQVMMVLHVFRLAKRPISTLISCINVIYNYFFGLPTDDNLERNFEREDNLTNGVNNAGSVINDERLMCVVCQDIEKSVMAHPCRHISMCRQCADEVMFEQRRCPMCRAYIVEIVDVFL